MELDIDRLRRLLFRNGAGTMVLSMHIMIHDRDAIMHACDACDGPNGSKLGCQEGMAVGVCFF